MSPRATKRPEGSSCGITIAGMNWTAWNSVSREGADEQAERHAERGIADGEEREGERVAGEGVELGERRRHQPLERPGRALAQHRHRGDNEHRDEGERPSSGAPTCRD